MQQLRRASSSEAYVRFYAYFEMVGIPAVVVFILLMVSHVYGCLWLALLPDWVAYVAEGFSHWGLICRVDMGEGRKFGHTWT